MPYGLTPREMEIASRLAKGWTDSAITSELVISRATLAAHLERIMAKVGVETREALIERLRAEGPLQDSPVAYGLTERELLILRLAKVGRSDATIADNLIVSVMTVRAHLSSIARKMGVATREEVIERAQREGLG